MQTKRKNKKLTKKKLGVVVPYRDRKEHLNIFKRRISTHLETQEIPHEIFIINQYDYGLFNRGMLLNIGFFYAVESGCDYVVFHDVDMIPMDVDYNYSDVPIHLATNFIDRKTRQTVNEIFDEYFGGVTMFSIEDFKKINGYSNRYWGWGYEDTDLLLRCKTKQLPLDTIMLRNLNNKGTKLKFNGNDAFVKCRNFNNLLDFNSDLTLFVSFCPNVITLDHLREMDEFSVFSIEGFNTSINYNSFQRYNFVTFDENDNPLYINSNIKTNYQTNLAITFDSKRNEIKFYQDGILISKVQNYGKVRSYVNEQIFYLGCSKNNSKRLDNFFNGLLDRFAIYSKVLSEKEIYTISHYESTPLTQNNDDYNSAMKLKLYYDTNFIKEYKLVDLSGNGNDGEIVNCEIIDETLDDYKNVLVPYRRKSEFLLLNHEPNGYVDNKWKSTQTRWNQLRYHNEVYKNPQLFDEDGLNDLRFTEQSIQKENNYTFINVTIT